MSNIVKYFYFIFHDLNFIKNILFFIFKIITIMDYFIHYIENIIFLMINFIIEFHEKNLCNKMVLKYYLKMY